MSENKTVNQMAFDERGQYFELVVTLYLLKYISDNYFKNISKKDIDKKWNIIYETIRDSGYFDCFIEICNKYSHNANLDKNSPSFISNLIDIVKNYIIKDEYFVDLHAHIGYDVLNDFLNGYKGKTIIKSLPYFSLNFSTESGNESLLNKVKLENLNKFSKTFGGEAYDDDFFDTINSNTKGNFQHVDFLFLFEIEDYSNHRKRNIYYDLLVFDTSLNYHIYKYLSINKDSCDILPVPDGIGSISRIYQGMSISQRTRAKKNATLFSSDINVFSKKKKKSIVSQSNIQNTQNSFDLMMYSDREIVKIIQSGSYAYDFIKKNEFITKKLKNIYLAGVGAYGCHTDSYEYDEETMSILHWYSYFYKKTGDRSVKMSVNALAYELFQRNTNAMDKIINIKNYHLNCDENYERLCLASRVKHTEAILEAYKEKEGKYDFYLTGCPGIGKTYSINSLAFNKDTIKEDRLFYMYTAPRLAILKDFKANIFKNIDKDEEYESKKANTDENGKPKTRKKGIFVTTDSYYSNLDCCVVNAAGYDENFIKNLKDYLKTNYNLNLLEDESDIKDYKKKDEEGLYSIEKSLDNIDEKVDESLTTNRIRENKSVMDNIFKFIRYIMQYLDKIGESYEIFCLCLTSQALEHSLYNTKSIDNFFKRIDEIIHPQRHLYMFDEITGSKTITKILSDVRNRYDETHKESRIKANFIYCDANIPNADIANAIFYGHSDNSFISGSGGSLFVDDSNNNDSGVIVNHLDRQKITEIGYSGYPSKTLDISFNLINKKYKSDEHLKLIAELVRDSYLKEEYPIVYIQNKKDLSVIKTYLSSYCVSEEIIQVITSDEKHNFNPNELNKKSIYLITSSASRGITFPKAKRTFITLPNFKPMESFAEILQVIFRQRGTLEGWVNNEEKDKHLTVFIEKENIERVFKDEIKDKIRYNDMYNIIKKIDLFLCMLVSRISGGKKYYSVSDGNKNLIFRGVVCALPEIASKQDNQKLTFFKIASLITDLFEVINKSFELDSIDTTNFVKTLNESNFVFDSDNLVLDIIKSTFLSALNYMIGNNSETINTLKKVFSEDDLYYSFMKLSESEYKANFNHSLLKTALANNQENEYEIHGDFLYLKNIKFKQENLISSDITRLQTHLGEILVIIDAISKSPNCKIIKELKYYETIFKTLVESLDKYGESDSSYNLFDVENGKLDALIYSIPIDEIEKMDIDEIPDPFLSDLYIFVYELKNVDSEEIVFKTRKQKINLLKDWVKLEMQRYIYRIFGESEKNIIYRTFEGKYMGYVFSAKNIKVKRDFMIIPNSQEKKYNIRTLGTMFLDIINEIKSGS